MAGKNIGILMEVPKREFIPAALFAPNLHQI